MIFFTVPCRSLYIHIFRNTLICTFKCSLLLIVFTIIIKDTKIKCTNHKDTQKSVSYILIYNKTNLVKYCLTTNLSVWFIVVEILTVKKFMTLQIFGQVLSSLHIVWLIYKVAQIKFQDSNLILQWISEYWTSPLLW